MARRNQSSDVMAGDQLSAFAVMAQHGGEDLKHELDFRFPAIANHLPSQRPGCRVSKIQMGRGAGGSVVREFDLVQAVRGHVSDRIVDAISTRLVEHRGPGGFGPGFAYEKGRRGVFVEHGTLLYPFVRAVHQIAFPPWNPSVLLDRTSQGEHRIHGRSNPRLVVGLHGIRSIHFICPHCLLRLLSQSKRLCCRLSLLNRCRAA